MASKAAPKAKTKAENALISKEKTASSRAASPKEKPQGKAKAEGASRDKTPPKTGSDVSPGPASEAPPKALISSNDPSLAYDISKTAPGTRDKFAKAAESPRRDASPGAASGAPPQAVLEAPGAAAQADEAPGSSPDAAAPAKKREQLSAEAQEEEKRALGEVWSLISKGKKDIRTTDIERMIGTANVNEAGPGARVDPDALRDFMQAEFGAKPDDRINQASLMEKASTYFNNCTPSEECVEVWQMLGGSLTGEGTVEAADICDTLERLNCDITKEEVDDLVAFASKGSSRMSYDDFVESLFP